jgi:hypothetical protein
LAWLTQLNPGADRREQKRIPKELAPMLIDLAGHAGGALRVERAELRDCEPSSVGKEELRPHDE